MPAGQRNIGIGGQGPLEVHAGLLKPDGKEFEIYWLDLRGFQETSRVLRGSQKAKRSFIDWDCREVHSSRGPRMLGVRRRG